MRNTIFTLLAMAALVLSPGCTNSSSTEATADPSHAAVVAYLAKHLDDPSSYQGARWGAARIWSRGDEARERQRVILADLAKRRADVESLAEGSRRIFATAGQPVDPVVAADNARRLVEIQRQEAQARALPIHDTIRLGVLLTHAFRAKNKMGGLVLDSAEFLVTPSNQAAPYVHPVIPTEQ